MLTAGPVHYEVGGKVDATSFGGIAAVHRVVARLGLPAAIDADLELLKVHLPYHESDHVLNLAYNVACGGTRLLGAATNDDGGDVFGDDVNGMERPRRPDGWRGVDGQGGGAVVIRS